MKNKLLRNTILTVAVSSMIAVPVFAKEFGFFAIFITIYIRIY